MKRPRTNFGLVILIVIGVALMTGGVVLHWALPAQYERVEIIPIGVGLVIALFAAIWIDPNRALMAARGVTETTGAVVRQYREYRTGDRKGDPVVAVEKTTDPANPDAGDAVKVTVTTNAPGTAAVPVTDSAPPRPDITESPPAFEVPVVPPLAAIPAKEKGDL
jgi:hypothetical protein